MVPIACISSLTGEWRWPTLNRMVQYRAARNINRVTAAIADPTRRAILERLARGSARISDVAEPFSMSLTGFCKHVRVLERAGLVRRTRRGREKTLHLSPKPLQEVAEWILKYEPFWTERLDRLEAFFANEKEKSR
jgi:DNA-binding transcriptional ArsR family regulator